MTGSAGGPTRDTGSAPAVGYPRPWGDYLLLERLGSGGMSEVDLARKIVDDGAYVRFTVIKRIKADKTADESFVRMFKDEARITSELHHAKIGTVYDFGRVGEEWFLALEYVPGVDVRYLINVLRERGQRVPVRIALRVITDVLDALDYAHAKKDTLGKRMGIVHRDVNPRNVMVSIRGEVKLIDFGVAKATDRLERTQTDHVKGKFAYMAPEQISGQAIDHRADVYAAGLTLHELLSGVSPFHGLNQVQILHRMLGGRPPALPPLPEIPDAAGLAAIQGRALAHAVDDRYPTAAAMAEDLRAFAAGLGGLPSNDQLAAFLASVDPELTDRLQSKMEAWAVAGAAGAPPPGPLAVAAPPVAEASGTMGRLTDAESLTATRIGVVGGSLVLVSVVSAALAAAVVSVVLVGVWLWLRPDPPAAGPPAPAPAVAGTAPSPSPVAPAPPPPPDPTPLVDPDPAPRAAAPRPSPTVPAASTPDPVPDPVPDAVAPVPEPEPVAPPAPVDVGLLNVVSNPRGAVVRVDGVEVGRTPLERVKIPVGAHAIEVDGLTCAPRGVTIRKSVVTSVSCK